MTDTALKHAALPADLTPRETQRNASNPNVSVWVNASAGSGKTSVLTARFIRLMLAGVPPHKILCITFTRAAAAEMANRIQKRLALWATCDDAVLADELDLLQGHAPDADTYDKARRLFAKTLACPGGLRIRTIHAFCQEILGRFPLEADLPPHFMVIEEAEAADLREECLADVLRHAAHNHDTPLGNAVEYLATAFADKKLLGAAKALLDQRARYMDARDAAGSLDDLLSYMRDTLHIVPGEDENLISAAALASVPCDVLRELATILAGHKSKFVRDFCSNMLGWLSDAADYDAYTSLYLTDKDEPRAFLTDPKHWADYGTEHDVLRCELRRIDLVRAKLEALSIATSTEAMLRLGDAMIVRYEARKAVRAALDFNDLITRTEKLLRRPDIAPWVLYKLDGGLDHILVDEAQDTSASQWAIVDILTDEFFAGRTARDDTNRTLFVVGDEKQSIYSFQNADPEAFLGMYDPFVARIKTAEKQMIQQPLRVSFRSAPAVLQAVDAVFADPAAQSGVSVDPIKHEAFHKKKIGHVELWGLVPLPPKEKKADAAWELPLEDYGYEVEPQNELATRIASTIKDWLTRDERLGGTGRAIVPGDIMILLRRRGGFADRMVRALKMQNIPVTGVDRMRLVEQLPVMDVLALAQFALLPEDDLTLACLLRSPFIGVTEEQLMQLAIVRKGTLWKSLATHAEKQDGDFATAYDYLSTILLRADAATPLTFFAEALNAPCPGSPISGRHALWQRLGHDALDPLQELLSAAQDFGARHSPSLQSFLHWLSQANAEIKREMDAGDDGAGGMVRIMTVHAAKGLEAPIVFLPDASGTPRVQDLAEFMWHDDAGISVPFFLAKRPGFGVPHELYANARRKQMEEYRRLLYVAMTRPEQRLIIAGWEKKGEQEKDQSWHALASRQLKTLHEPHRVRDDAVVKPVIIFADPEMPTDVALKLPAVKQSGVIELPVWARTQAPDEVANLKHIAPSHLGDDANDDSLVAAPDASFTRGRIIHRLLQSLPDVKTDKRAEAAARFLSNPQHHLTQALQKEIADEVFRLLTHPDYAPLFGVGSRAEVPVIGRIAGRVMPGQIDRLAMVGDEVWVVDYKTNRPPPTDIKNVPETYRLQLAAYRAVLEKVYKVRKIRCFLLWTYRPLLMEIPDTMLVFSALKRA